jgi:1-aminocyclopropane-1-carboxylate deaminase/D-cysteine desulfhydrase-like pyridoxal-dependent ACC family enzyme
MQDCGLSDTAVQLLRAGDYAMRAMDAVCHAEHLYATETQAAELAALRVQLHRTSRQSEEIAEAMANQKISVKARKAAIKRHAEHYAMKEDVIAWCKEHFHEYSSMEEAALAAVKQVPAAFRTVRSWIRQYRDELQSARRL